MLDDVKGNWERRLSCLRRLQSLALGSLADSSLAPALVKLVRSGLVNSCKNLGPPNFCVKKFKTKAFPL